MVKNEGRLGTRKDERGGSRGEIRRYADLRFSGRESFISVSGSRLGLFPDVLRSELAGRLLVRDVMVLLLAPLSALAIEFGFWEDARTDDRDDRFRMCWIILCGSSALRRAGVVSSAAGEADDDGSSPP